MQILSDVFISMYLEIKDMGLPFQIPNVFFITMRVRVWFTKNINVYKIKLALNTVCEVFFRVAYLLINLSFIFETMYA